MPEHLTDSERIADLEQRLFRHQAVTLANLKGLLSLFEMQRDQFRNLEGTVQTIAEAGVVGVELSNVNSERLTSTLGLIGQLSGIVDGLTEMVAIEAGLDLAEAKRLASQPDLRVVCG